MSRPHPEHASTRTPLKVQPRVEGGRIEAAPQGTDAAELRPLAHRKLVSIDRPVSGLSSGRMRPCVHPLPVLSHSGCRT
jgi:hypothetical protein